MAVEVVRTRIKKDHVDDRNCVDKGTTKINVNDKNRKFPICYIIRFPKKLSDEMPSPREKKGKKKKKTANVDGEN